MPSGTLTIYGKPLAECSTEHLKEGLRTLRDSPDIYGIDYENHVIEAVLAEARRRGVLAEIEQTLWSLDHSDEIAAMEAEFDALPSLDPAPTG
jgi:hypothetical protein